MSLYHVKLVALIPKNNEYYSTRIRVFRIDQKEFKAQHLLPIHPLNVECSFEKLIYQPIVNVKIQSLHIPFHQLKRLELQ